jgi:tetratricopeptide (TPR) repeat protein
MAESAVMRCRLLMTIVVAVFVPVVAMGQVDPDELYRQREDLSRAREAADIWQQRVAANPKDFESLWKLARATYWLGEHDQQDARRTWLERGVEAGRSAAALAPKRPEGYFWMAANMGALAESFGIRQGLRYRGPIRDALETVLRLDPGYLDGSADRALGRWYHRVPGLFGGDKKKAEAHLRTSLTYNPNSTISHFFLAETLFELDRDAEALAELQKVIDAPFDPQFTPEDREFKKKAAERLAKVGR